MIGICAMLIIGMLACSAPTPEPTVEAISMEQFLKQAAQNSVNTHPEICDKIYYYTPQINHITDIQKAMNNAYNIGLVDRSVQHDDVLYLMRHLEQECSTTSG